MNKKIIIGCGLAAIGIAALAYAHYKPINNRKTLIKLFIEKNYTAISEQLTEDEQKKLEDAIFNLTEKEQKTLLKAYKNSDASNMDELSKILDKLRPVMDLIKPAYDIKRIELGKKEVVLYVKNAISPNLTLNYSISPMKMDVSLVTAMKDGKALMTLRYNKGKLAAFEDGKKIQEEEIVEKKPIVISKAK